MIRGGAVYSRQSWELRQDSYSFLRLPRESLAEASVTNILGISWSQAHHSVQ
jgi:hypothetical protein